MWERRGLEVEGQGLGPHELGDDVDCFLLLDDVANPTGVLFEQGDDRLALRFRDPREAERLELGQKLGRTSVVRDQRIAVAKDGGSSGEQLAQRAGDGDGCHSVTRQSGCSTASTRKLAKLASLAGGPVLLCWRETLKLQVKIYRNPMISYVVSA